MNEYKEKFILDIYDFMDNYEYNSHLTVAAIAAVASIQEIINCYFHDNSQEAQALNNIMPILETFKIHTLRYIENANN